MSLSSAYVEQMQNMVMEVESPISSFVETGWSRKRGQMTETKSEVQAEIDDLKAKIAAIHESEPFEAETDDGARYVESDPYDGLDYLMTRLDDAYERMQQIVNREAYLKASGG
jgi:hypothetical protein